MRRKFPFTIAGARAAIVRSARRRLLLLIAAIVVVVLLARTITPGPGSNNPVNPATSVNSLPVAADEGNVEASLPVHQAFDVVGPVLLDFDGLNGSLSIETGAPGKLEVSATKIAYGYTEDQALTRVARVPLDVRQEPGRVTFSPGSASALPRVDYHLVAPEDAGLKVVNGHGSVEAAGLHRGVDLTGDDVAARLTNVGPASVTIKRGGIVVDGAAGPVHLETASGSIQAQHLSGPSAALVASGDVSVKETEVVGHLAITSAGAVSLERSKGNEIDVTSPGGTIELTDTTTVAALRLRSGAGDVTVERDMGHPLAVTTSSGGVSFTNVQGDVQVTTAGAPVSFYDSAVSSLAVTSKGGDVFFSGTLPATGASSVDTGGGQLRLAIARESAFALDADAGRGKLNVQSDFQADPSLSGPAVKTLINGGGPPVVLRTHDGQLSIVTK